MKTAKISQAAQRIRDANTLIENLKKQIAALERENLGLKKALSERTRELQQLKSTTHTQLKKVIKGLKVKTKDGHIKEIKPVSFDPTYKAQREEQRKQLKEKVRKMEPKEQSMYMKDNVHVPQFLQRLQEKYVEDWDPAWTAKVSAALSSMSPTEFYILVHNLGLEKMAYESDTSYDPSDVNTPYQAHQIAQEIIRVGLGESVDFKPDLTGSDAIII